MSQTDNDVQDIPTDSETTEVTTTRTDEQSNEAVDEEEELEGIIEEEQSIYDPDDFLSEPIIGPNSDLPLDILEFDFNYGYNCRKYFNLVAVDENTLVFSSGNFIHFFDVETKKIWFRRSALGGGIGHITKNPNPEYFHLAIAENGEHPIIIVYEWPEMSINCILRGGSSKLYSHLDYSPDGELMVSQGGEPDYLITVWDWPKHKILLRTKSYVNDIFRVKFSPYVPGQITTCGITHIKFWKMATTFTGLKLKGEVGRFGKTEYSDILGILPMPDEKVVSGSSWGNILIWDAGLIKLEVFRTQRRNCHDGPIVQFYFNEGELWTVSMDGHIKVWWYEKIEQADPPDDDRVVLVEPTYDFYTKGLMLMSILKRNIFDLNDTFYFAQDGNGGIWTIDLNTEDKPKPSVQLYVCHAGKVMDIAACPYAHYLASLGEGGGIYLYDYIARKKFFSYQFQAKGVCMIWLSLDRVNAGDEIFLGFDDGQVRVCILNIPSNINDTSLEIIQVIKPHTQSVTTMSINETGTLLVTGSKDSTIFIFQVEKNEDYVSLTPIGFMPTPDVVTCITWQLDDDGVIIVGCNHGHMMEVELPYGPIHLPDDSFLLNNVTTYTNKFTTYKAQIRRNIKVAEINAKKADKVARKRKEMERLKKENPGLEFDEDIFLADSESEEELEPLHIPEIPNRIIWLQCTPDGTVWLSMAGYDAGYIYEYFTHQRDEIPYRFKMVDDADDIEISSYVYTYDKDYLIFGMQDGSIRVNKVNKDDFRDLSNYWKYSMHDNQNGFIPKMCFSYDEQYFFSCGYDGNIFAYKFHPKDYTFNKDLVMPEVRIRQISPAKDVHPYEKLSLQEEKVKAERDRLEKVANAHKKVFYDKIKHLRERFAKLLEHNEKLLPSQRLSKQDLELDERLTGHIDRQLKNNLELVRRKLIYEVEKSRVIMEKCMTYYMKPLDFIPINVHAINSDNFVMTVTQRVFSKKFEEVVHMIEDRLHEEETKDVFDRPLERTPVKRTPKKTRPLKEQQLEYFLMSLSPSVIEMKLGPKLCRLLAKYRARRQKWDNRQLEWEDFNAQKPAPGVNYPQDEVDLSRAKATIGDYKLKTSQHYIVPAEKQVTTIKKYNQLLCARERQFSYRHNFIKKVYALRDKKTEIRSYLIEKTDELHDIHGDIPKHFRLNGPPIFDINPDEFPEKNLEVVVVIPQDETISDEYEDTSHHQLVPVRTKKRRKNRPDRILHLFSERLFLDFEPDYNLLERQLIPASAIYPNFTNGGFIYPPENQIPRLCDMTIEELLATCENEEVDSSCENELRINRLNRKLFQQREVINSMHAVIDKFNYSVETLKQERILLHRTGNFIDIFISTIHQELIILKNFEEHENELRSKVMANLNAVVDKQYFIEELNNKIEEKNRQTEESLAAEKKIQDQFMHTVIDNKFYDFLKKVFRKRYKPPRVRTGDESSSESSSSSSDDSDEEDDAGSIDSKDFGFIKQDLSTCPKGCEQAIFDLTVTLRTQRHQVEQEITNIQKTVEALKKEVDLNLKKLKLQENQLKQSKDELESYQREKQQKLNKVNCTVIVSLDQIQHFPPDYTNENINNCLLFSKTELSKLYKRVGILDSETLKESEKYQIFVKHMKRMTADMKYMRNKIVDLKRTIILMNQQKFGKVTDLNELDAELLKQPFERADVTDLQEVMIRKMIYELRMKITDIHGMYREEMAIWKKKITKAQNELLSVIKANSTRLELHSIINKEKLELSHIIQNQPKKRELINILEESYNKSKTDIERLEDLIETQNTQIEDLKEEIKMLKTKGYPPRPIRRREERQRKPIIQEEEKEVEGEEDEEEMLTKWVDYDQYIPSKSTREDEEKEEESRESVVKDITIPGYFPIEAEDIVTNLVQEMFENLNQELNKKSMENIVREILSSILKCTSVTDILNGLINNLPIKPSEEQLCVIETTAEKLYALQEPDISDDDITKYALEVLEETIDEVMMTVGEPHEVIANMVNQLLDNIPFDIIMKEESILLIVKKIMSSITNLAIGRDELTKSVESLLTVGKAKARLVMNEILQRVYDTGIDYLYVINDKE